MTESPIFAAVPDGITEGAGNTFKVSEYAESMVESFDEGTAYDPNDPPWGKKGEVAEAFEEKYLEAHIQMREALHVLVAAITAAGTQTLNSGRGFSHAQDDAITAIHHEGGGRRH